MAFANSVIFNNREISEIGDSVIILTTITRKSQLSNTNIKIKNKKKKNNHKAKCNNNDTNQICIYFYYNKSRLPIFKTHTHLCRANQIEKKILNKVMSITQYMMVLIIFLPDVI